MSSAREIIQHDVDFIISKIGKLLLQLKHQRIFITGGTGFFGQWILDTIWTANKTLNLSLDVYVLTRNVSDFANQAGYLVDDPHFEFIEGDIKNFQFPEGEFKTIIHAATTRAEETYANEDALSKYDTVSIGTRRLLDFAVQAKTKQILWTSSGALYGQQPGDVSKISEDYSGSPDPMEVEASALGLGKRSAEFLCAYYGKRYNIDIKIARCFTFVGPRMQMNIHYAVGNFISDIVMNKPVLVKGDGTALRSYMYISDLIIWLWIILLKGKSSYPYNVGSDEVVSILELAKMISKYGSSKTDVKTLQTKNENTPANSYIPAIDRACTELNLSISTDLNAALKKTIEYERALISECNN